jgi:methionyl-tRNA formyltransferase
MWKKFHQKNNMNYRYVFFGTPHIAELSLQALAKHNCLPTLIVTAPARPQGRGLHLTETPVATFAHAHNIPVITPEKITPDIIAELQRQDLWDFFLVVGYGKILPQALLDIAHGKVINLHPSLLPYYRGPSPLETVLLSDDTETGVSIMELDAQVDHGPLLAQKRFQLAQSETITSLTEKSATLGIESFIEALPGYLAGTPAIAQDDQRATKTRKYTKIDGSIDTLISDWEKWKVFRALGDRGWVHFTAKRHDSSLTVKIIKASYRHDAFIIEEVIPENGKRQPYPDFLHSLN